MPKRVGIAVLVIGICAIASKAQTKQSMFVFQNNFWVNLRQFLRGEIYRQGANLSLGIDPTSLGESDRASWASSIEVYKDVAKGDLIFDDNARRIANALSMTADAARLPEGLLDARTTAALNAAAPIYRARLWPARQRNNDAWNASAKALVDRHGAAMAAALAKVYRVTWPSEPYLVDAVGEIGPNSAGENLAGLYFELLVHSGNTVNGRPRSQKTPASIRLQISGAQCAGARKRERCRRASAAWRKQSKWQA